MDIFSGLFLELPIFFSETQKRKAYFFFRFYNATRENLFRKIYLTCTIKNCPFSSTPLIGEIINTSNFLVKITTKKNTNIIGMVFIFLKLQKIIKFKKYFDFQYFSSSNENFFNIQNKNKNRRITLDKVFIPIDIVPSFFLKHSELKFKQNSNMQIFAQKNFSPDSSEFHREKRIISLLGIDRRSFTVNYDVSKFIINYQTDSPPFVPLIRFQKNLFFSPLFALGFILKLFKKRPIWAYKIIYKYCPPSLKRYLQKILPLISYRFYGTSPYRKVWIRYGYDPRQNKKSRIYQTLEVILKKKNMKKKESKPQSAFNFKLKKDCKKFLKEQKLNVYEEKNLTANEKICPKKKFLQLCDLNNIKIKKFLQKKKGNFFLTHFLLGWFTPFEIQSISN